VSFVADDTKVPLYEGISSNYIIGLNSDASFDDSFIYGNGFDAEVRVITIQPDGKILVGGLFSNYDGNSVNYIVRLNSDGSIDNTFNIGTGFDNQVFTIELQSDGKILVGGDFNNYNGTPFKFIVRLNSDGSIDNTFDIGGGFNNTVQTISIQSDGKILVGGSFVQYSGVGTNYIIRLNSDGSIDNTFVIGGGFNDTVLTITIQSDGKILVGGLFTDYGGNTANYIIRLNNNGSVDNTFTYGDGFNSFVRTIEVQSDEKILIGGEFTEYDGTLVNYIIRLNPDGSIDNTFVTGSGISSTVRSIQLLQDGKMLVGGDFTIYDGTIISNYIIKLNSDGSFDDSFIIDTGFNSTVYSIKVKNDQSLLIGGSFQVYKQRIINYLIRLNTSGLYDDSLNYKLGFGKTVRTISIQSDGKIVVGGEFEIYENITVNRIVRLNPDGSIDNTFVTGHGFNGDVYTLILQPDGKILVGGDFTEFDSGGFNRIIRLNDDGSIDNTFVIGGGFNDTVLTITIQSDGKILVGGGFTDFDGNSVNSIVRLNTDGTFDNTFNSGTGFDEKVYTISNFTSGRLLVGGAFSDYDGTTSKKIVIINSDGSFNTTFGSGIAGSTVYTTILQSDGKILVGGNFAEFDGVPTNNIIRLNNDGTVDNTFVNGTGFNSPVFDIKIQDDGKIIIGGEFTEYDGYSVPYICRINSNGSIDTSFIVGDGFDDIVYSIQIQSDDKILVGGAFTTYPLKSGIFQLAEGDCVFVDDYGIVSRNAPEEFITFGPFISCSECTTPDNSPGTESIICVTCDDPNSVTSTTAPHGIYLDEQGRAIAQINTIAMGGFNGLNN
jgi:uncharacterized delta-60 repeat protein